MLALTFWACLAGSPVDCREVSLVYDGQALTPMACLVHGQAEIARWISEHPGYELRRDPTTGSGYRCGPLHEARRGV